MVESSGRLDLICSTTKPQSMIELGTYPTAPSTPLQRLTFWRPQREAPRCRRLPAVNGGDESAVVYLDRHLLLKR
jgi:hypothetical protein